MSTLPFHALVGLDAAQQARIDVIATLRTAAPWQRIRQNGNGHVNGNGNGRPRRIQLEMSDIRVKQYRSKAGA